MPSNILDGDPLALVIDRAKTDTPSLCQRSPAVTIVDAKPVECGTHPPRQAERLRRAILASPHSDTDFVQQQGAVLEDATDLDPPTRPLAATRPTPWMRRWCCVSGVRNRLPEMGPTPLYIDCYLEPSNNQPSRRLSLPFNGRCPAMTALTEARARLSLVAHGRPKPSKRSTIPADDQIRACGVHAPKRPK